MINFSQEHTTTNWKTIIIIIDANYYFERFSKPFAICLCDRKEEHITNLN